MRGRKYKAPNYKNSKHVEIYPREGTETARRNPRQNNPTLKFIPVRGRKREGETHRSGIRVEIYPREGTETRSAGLANHIRCHNYPSEGIETRDVETIESSFFSNLNDKFNPKGLYKKGKMC